MHHLVILLFIWLLGYLFVDWSRLRELLPAMLTGMLLAGVPTALPGLEPFYQLSSSPTESYRWVVLYLMQMTAAPMLSAWFAQGLPRGGPLPGQRVMGFALMVWGPELPGYFLGRLVYVPWWGPLHTRVRLASPRGSPPRTRGEQTGVLRSSGGCNMDPQLVDR